MGNSKENKKLRVVQGRVVSDKMEKTRVILVETLKMHPIFKKAMRRSRKIHVHDEKGEAKLGDLVQAVETRPLSRLKRHRLFKIVERAK